jgi:hypothetical protein
MHIMDNLENNQIALARNSYFENGFVKLEGFIPTEISSFLIAGTSIAFNPRLEPFKENLDDPRSVVTAENTSYASYGSVLGDTLLAFLTESYSAITGKRLAPTYSFLRKYTKGQRLKSHKDRPSCQYSITIPINTAAADWPFYVKDNNKEQVKITCNVGDAILYMGERVDHWRDNLQDDVSIHAFLHWIDIDDPTRKEYIFDKRNALGSGADQKK